MIAGTVLFVVICHPFTSASIVFSVSPPACLSICLSSGWGCFCSRLRDGPFSSGDITSTDTNTHPGSRLSVAHFYEYETEWPSASLPLQ